MHDLILSDQEYFRTGSSWKTIPGGSFTASTARSEAVVLVDCLDSAADNPREWLNQVLLLASSLRRKLMRIYLPARYPRLETQLSAANFHRRTELLFQGTPRLRTRKSLTLHKVTSEDDWQHKLRFHEQVSDRPDGYPCSADEWVAFERSKVKPLRMTCYLAVSRGHTIGAVASIPRPGYSRVKNLVVHPSYRSTGVAGQILETMATSDEGVRSALLGMLAVRGSRGHHLYRSVGLEVVGEYHEWSVLVR